MKIGIFIGSMGAATGLMGQVQQAVDAENDGFDSFWSAQVAGVDALTLFALAGQRTERIRMGTAVVPTFQRHPVMLAQQALTANAATGGRIDLGIGLSHRPTVEDRWGLPFERPARHMSEYLSVLRSLVEGGSAHFEGEIFRVNADIDVPSAEPFPILVAALAPRMLRIAGEQADGTVTWMVGPSTLRTHVVPRITAAAADAGRPAPRVCVGLPIAVTDDPVGARLRAAEHFGRYGLLPSYRRMLDIEGVESPADISVVGSEDEVTEQLAVVAEAGATELLASIFPYGGDEEASVARTRALLKSLLGKL